MPAGKILDLGVQQPLAANVAAPLSSEQAHKILLHSGYHLVHHHEATQPHLPHGIGTLVLILVLVHLIALSYLAYLFSKPVAPARARPRRGADLKPLRCENDWLRAGGGGGGRAVPGRSANV